MRIIRFESDEVDVTDDKPLRANVDYVTTRTLLSHYCVACDGCLSVRPYTIEKPFSSEGDWNGKRILIHRFGCAGDLLFITPLLGDLKKRWPTCHLTVHCEQKYHWVFANNPHVDNCLSSPLLREDVDAFDAQINLEDATEYSPLAKTQSAVDVFAATAGLTLSDNKTFYRPSDALVHKMAQRFPRSAAKRVGISLTSNSVIRNYPYKSFLEVIGALMKAGVQVVLLGPAPTGVKRQPLFIDLAGERPRLTWEESVAFMKTCDVVLGADSSAIHFAGAMGVASLGLYGSFLARLRIPSQPATQAIQATGACAPCFHHGRKHVDFPPEGPCRESGQCDVLASISPTQVVAKIIEMLGGEGP
ncbi:MAG: glycosyltransferase family 9 protein [Alphaproteobacteria bacterium]|nr:glycosyltransferase family 9 protein [Alphaproteobacteria bacterium]